MFLQSHLLLAFWNSLIGQSHSALCKRRHKPGIYQEWALHSHFKGVNNLFAMLGCKEHHVCHVSALSNSWIFWVVLGFGTFGEFCMCAAHQTGSKWRFWCVDMSVSSFGTIIQIKIVGVLLSCRRVIKGINTLKQEHKGHEQEAEKKSLVLQEEVTISKEREEPGYVFWGV